MAMVKQQTFIFRIVGVHSSLERRVKTYAAGLQLGQVFKGLRSFVLYLQLLNAELVFATKVVQIIKCTCTVFIDNFRNISANSSI